MRPALPATLRQTVIRRTPPRARFASSSTEAAQQKAKEALGSAQKNAGKALDSAVKFLGPLGQKAGNLLGGYRQPIFYNFAVAREIVKQVYRTEALQPPSFGTIQSVYETLWSRARSMSYWREAIRNGELLRVGIYGVEAYTIFKVGEIIGRRSLVGYDLH